MFAKQPSMRKAKPKKKPAESNKRSTSTSSRASAKGSKKVAKKPNKSSLALDFGGIETDISLVLSPDSSRRRASPKTSPRTPRKDSPRRGPQSPARPATTRSSSPRSPRTPRSNGTKAKSPKSRSPQSKSPRKSPSSPDARQSPRFDDRDLEAARRQINELISEREKLLFTAGLKDSRIAELEKMLEDDKASIGILRADVQSCMADHQRAVSMNNSLRREIMALERELVKKDQTEIITQSKNCELEAKLASLQKSHEHTLKISKDLQRELAEKTDLMSSQKESTSVEIMRLKRDLGEQGRIARYNLSKLEVDHARISTENIEQKYIIVKQSDKIRYLADANTALSMVSRGGSNKKDTSHLSAAESSPAVSRKSEEYSTPKSTHWR